jgi:hypothetical protein
MRFADMTRTDRAAYFNFHGDKLLNARADFLPALERYAGILKNCGAFENSGTTAEKFVADALETLDYSLAEEVRSYIGAG